MWQSYATTWHKCPGCGNRGNPISTRSEIPAHLRGFHALADLCKESSGLLDLGGSAGAVRLEVSQCGLRVNACVGQLSGPPQQQRRAATGLAATKSSPCIACHAPCPCRSLRALRHRVGVNVHANFGSQEEARRARASPWRLRMSAAPSATPPARLEATGRQCHPPTNRTTPADDLMTLVPVGPKGYFGGPSNRSTNR